MTEGVSRGQRRRGGRGARNVAARLHINQDGTITVMTGKVEEGQGSRAQLTQAHRYPSDIVLPGMLYGKVLRPPSYGATLESVNPSAVEAMRDVVAVRKREFLGLAAPSTFRADQALAEVAKTARWQTVSNPSSSDPFSHLKQHAGAGRPRTTGLIDEALAGAQKTLRETYQVSYIQHAPMEPRAATAQWKDGRIQSDSFSEYHVPRFSDVPKIDVHLVENREIPSAGGGETPIIAVAPAIANAVFASTGLRIRSMPLTDERLRRS